MLMLSDALDKRKSRREVAAFARTRERHTPTGVLANAAT
jgi:hypothetical protein